MAIVSRDFESTSGEYGEVASAVVSSYPFTFACWVKPESVGTAGVIFAIATSGSANNYWRVDISAGGANRTRARDGASVSDAITTTTMTAGNWYFIGAVFNSATDRRAFLGTDKATNTTSRTPSGINRTSVARSADTGGTATFDGLIALPTLWNAALSDADMSSLAGGSYPTTVQSGSLVAHWPFDNANPGDDTIGTNDLTFNGSAFSSDAPPVSSPGTVYNDSLTESLTAADSVSAAATFAPSLTEALTAGDSLASSATFAPSVSEALTSADSLAAAATFNAARAEALTAAGTVAAAATYNATRAEALTAADSLGAAATFNPTLSEGVTGSDSVTDGGPQTYNNSLSEGVTASDSLSVSVIFAASRAESLTAADSVSAAATFNAARSDPLTAADSLAAAATMSVSRAEALTAADTVSAAATFTPALSESLTAGDSVAAAATFRPALTESLTASDGYAESVGQLDPGLGLGWRLKGERLHWTAPEGRLQWVAPPGALKWSEEGRLRWAAPEGPLHWTIA